MKTILTFIRHGETEWNIQNRFQGNLDSPLTQEGRNQAELVSKALGSRPFDFIISSDLKRALETAKIINGTRNLRIFENESVRERRFGIIEGLTHEEIKNKYPEIYATMKERHADFQVPEGESFKEFYDRVINGVDNIVADNIGKKLLIITHGGVLNCLIRKVFNYPFHQRRNFSIRNTTINTISVHNEHWILEEWGVNPFCYESENLNESDENKK